jgi:hypothetical protein
VYADLGKDLCQRGVDAVEPSVLLGAHAAQHFLGMVFEIIAHDPIIVICALILQKKQ